MRPRNVSRVLAVLFAMGLALNVWADSFYFFQSVSATQSNSAVSFTDNMSGGTSAAFRAKQITIKSLSASANTCYYDLRDTTATTADYEIAPGETHVLQWNNEREPTDGWSGVGVICSTGQTATIKVYAKR